MRVAITQNGLTLRVIAGTHSAIIAMDLQENKRKGCLGFAIYREDLDGPRAGQGRRALPSMLRFPSVPGDGLSNTEESPLQKFRWGDYTVQPGRKYRYTVVPRFGAPGKLVDRPDLPEVSVDVTTEDPKNPETAVYFNRAAAASEAFNREFPNVQDLGADTPDASRARAWLSNGLEEAIIAFLGQAQQGDALHGAIYEFQKPELLQGLKDAIGRGVDVKFVYHGRRKNAKDQTVVKNEAAIRQVGLPATAVKVRKENPQTAIMHDKFVVWLKPDGGGAPRPAAVWTGSTNWTEGGVYGQLNVGHGIYEPGVAAAYEQLWQLLWKDLDASDQKRALAALTPVSLMLPDNHGVIPIFSPQDNDTMLHLYAGLADGASMLMVSAPFALSPIILSVIARKRDDVLRFMLLDKTGSLGTGEEVHLIQGDPSDQIAVATTLSSPLHDFQGKVLEGKEGFHHAGIHIHSKVILVDPLGTEPIIVTGSANFSHNSTEENDSNSLVIRGYTAVTDIYTTEFMRMFEHYHFRAKLAEKGAQNKPMQLAEDDSWSDKYYISGSTEAKDRRMFAGTN